MGAICECGCINNVLLKILKKQKRCKKIIPFVIYKNDGTPFRARICKKRTKVFMVIESDCYCAHLVLMKRVGKCKYVPTKSKIIIDISCFCGIECIKRH